MMTPMRYVCLVLGVLISLHFLLSVTHEDYKNATSLNRLKTWPSSGPPYKDIIPSASPNATERVNAAFVVLARNGDLQGILESIKQMEDRFNKKYQYPYVFLNEEPFSDEFKKWTTEVVGSKTVYGQIPHDHWFQPDWIDEEKATKARLKMIEEKVIYGHSVPYRNMCRFNSGFFFRHELLKNYDYYWRIEPNVKFYCDIDYDPFKVMKDGKKVYGFTVSLYEYPATIPTLWDATKEFIKANPQYLPKDNAMGFLSDNNGETYNNCHFWSNFEIGDLNFWRGEAYMKYFEHLDSKGGFYYERWGDAPVHSIGAGLFARKDQIHFFNDIGYKHDPFMHCPQGEAHARGKCWCDAKQNFDYEWMRDDGCRSSLWGNSISRAQGLAKYRTKYPYNVNLPTPVSLKRNLNSQFLACVNRAESAKRLKATFRSTVGVMAAEQIEILWGENLRAVQESDVVLLCCKPQMAVSILGATGMASALEGKLLISILAGVTIQQLTEMVPASTRVVRAMPNTPCRIREGMTVVSAIPSSSSPTPSELDLQLELDRAIILAIFSSIGRCRFLDEKHFDACTALSGSGPAFACIVLEAMADGGVMMGLPRTEALELAAQTLQGTARMVLQSGQHPAQVKDSVTTPGGCTIAGLLTLEDGRVRSTIARAIQVATERASVLGQPAQGTVRKGTGSPEARD
ncbi:unnamed protein product [Rhizoctonia solani]|uniref:Pyrroline-5-carboxylate reductase n=1 Tax=Rhizoctonia solani TaxID=456999 RepID=A0A8H3HXR6_9AGAM|nr:unnamed protein product [Rhizoctonia solani]